MTLCDPSNYVCHFFGFPLWLWSEHWGVLVVLVIALIATAICWPYRP